YPQRTPNAQKTQNTQKAQKSVAIERMLRDVRSHAWRHDSFERFAARRALADVRGGNVRRIRFDQDDARRLGGHRGGWDRQSLAKSRQPAAQIVERRART